MAKTITEALIMSKRSNLFEEQNDQDINYIENHQKEIIESIDSILNKCQSDAQKFLIGQPKIEPCDQEVRGPYKNRFKYNSKNKTIETGYTSPKLGIKVTSIKLDLDKYRKYILSELQKGLSKYKNLYVEVGLHGVTSEDLKLSLTFKVKPNTADKVEVVEVH